MTFIILYRTPDGSPERWLALSDNHMLIVSDWVGDAHEFHDCHQVHNAIVIAYRELTPRTWRGRWVAERCEVGAVAA